MKKKNITESPKRGLYHRFTTVDVEESQKLDVLREYLKGVDAIDSSSVFGAQGIADLEDRGASAGNLMVGTRTVTGQMRRSRSRTETRRSSLNVVLFCTLERGDLVSDKKINMGEVYVVDTRKEYDMVTTGGFVTKNIMIPGEDLGILESEISKWHGQAIQGGMGSFLYDYIKMMNDAVDNFQSLPGDADLATRNILAATLAPSARTHEEARQQLDRIKLFRAKRFINENIMNPRLSLEGVCAYVGVSKRSLQRLFEAEEISVVHYVREERLSRAWEDLCLGREKKVSAVASKYGFSSAAYFCACFKARFGCLPRDTFNQFSREGADLGELAQVPIRAKGLTP